MIASQETEALRQNQQRAHNCFTEVLTSVTPEVKEALVALYHLVQAEHELLRCQCRSFKD